MTQGGGLFIYGTLRHVPLLTALIGGRVGARAAVLHDHRVVSWPGVHNPYLERYAGEMAQGLVLETLNDDQRRALDSYEVPFGYFPQDVEVTLEDGTAVRAAVYYPDPNVERTNTLWDLGTWAAAHADVAVAAATEIAAHDPPLGPEQLQAQWHMIQARAHSRVRAASEPGVSTLRHGASADVVIAPNGPITGRFFKLAAMTAQYPQFDGSLSEPLVRETLVGVDAALILPFDVRRGRVLLVEQFRAGLARRGDPVPWSLEPMAGIIDAGETPEQAAKREGFEEAGLRMTQVERMFQMYPSPGSSTDCFYCFLGHADLPSLVVGHGGLADEHEDLRLHVMDLEDAITLTETGEANAGPLIAMLLWLARHRERLEFAVSGA